MKHAARFATMLVIAGMLGSGFPSLPRGSISASGGQHGSGGHASSGGHAGHTGLSSGGVGHNTGRAISHSVGHFFGGHSKKGASTPDIDPFTTTRAVHPKSAKPSGSWVMSAGSPFHDRRFINDFPFGNRFRFFRRNGFGDEECEGFGFPQGRFFAGGDFNCFGGGFFFDPFFVSDFSDTDDPPANAMAAMKAEADADSEINSSGTYVGEDASPAPTESVSGLGLPIDAKNDQTATLLQLRDGSMYGLTDYWVEGDELHYRTTYGGEGSVKLDRIDLPKTVQLNAGRGVAFDLNEKAKTR